MGTAAPVKAEHFCPSCNKSWTQALPRCPACKTALVSLAVEEGGDELIGKELDGRFTIRAKLGEGGMGTVYRALQHSMGREVALKVISAKGAEHAAAAKRFLREAKLASRLAQPNIVGVVDFGQAPDGLLYLAMELCVGRTLSKVIRHEAPLPLARALRIAVQLCDALDAAHRLGIVHRDLKPANVIVLDQPEGRDLLKVLDFGLARSLEGEESSLTGSKVVGSPNYVSPEALTGQPVDARADLYSLGAILCEMLSGSPPHGREGGFTEIARRQLTRPPPSMQGRVPPALEGLIHRLLSVQPDQRPDSAATLRALLDAFASGGEPACDTVPARSRAPPPARRARLAVLAGALGLAALAGAVTLLVLRQGLVAVPAPAPLPVLVPPGPGAAAPAPEPGPAVEPGNSTVATPKRVVPAKVTCVPACPEWEECRTGKCVERLVR